MEFDIRAISLVESVGADARISVDDLTGKKIEFSGGLPYRITLPTAVDSFRRVADAERTLCALGGWARLYRYPNVDDDVIHVLAPAEGELDELAFYRIDLQERRRRRGPRLAAEISGGEVMSFDACAEWLIAFAARWLARPDERQRLLVLSRPSELAPPPVRIAWIGPEMLNGIQIAHRMSAVGMVFGAEVFHIPTLPFRDARDRLAAHMPLDVVILCRRWAPHLSSEAVPAKVSRESVFFYDGGDAAELEELLRDAIATSQRQIVEETENEGTLLLKLMVRAMLNHDKIGPFNHCPKETVLKCIRARRMNVPGAERILDENSETYLETSISEAMFLWKGHHDGRQYFLNARMVERTRQALGL